MHLLMPDREIAATEDDLRGLFQPYHFFRCSRITCAALLGRIKSVQEEIDKLSSGNQTLQMYIDNLTVQMAKRLKPAH